MYHVTAHGGDDRPLYPRDFDRSVCLMQFGRVALDCGWICHSYCLMDTHNHFLVETPEANLSAGMHRVNTAYAVSFNRRHGRRGHVFRCRFHSVVVEREEHLLWLSRYIVLNPVRAGICRRPEDWPWSSYRAMIGSARPEPFLTTEWLLAAFDEDLARARDQYCAYVEAGLDVPLL